MELIQFQDNLWAHDDDVSRWNCTKYEKTGLSSGHVVQIGWLALSNSLMFFWILQTILLSIKVSLARETIIPRTLETLEDTGNLFC